MRYRNQHIKISKLHFKKWRNTSFAIFCSIGREVIIGMVSMLLENLQTVKSSVLNRLTNEDFLDEEYPDEQFEQANELVTDLFIPVTININPQKSFPASENLKNTYFKTAFEALIGPFFLPSILKMQQIGANNSHNS